MPDRDRLYNEFCVRNWAKQQRKDEQKRLEKRDALPDQKDAKQSAEDAEQADNARKSAQNSNVEPVLPADSNEVSRQGEADQAVQEDSTTSDTSAEEQAKQAVQDESTASVAETVQEESSALGEVAAEGEQAVQDESAGQPLAENDEMQANSTDMEDGAAQTGAHEPATDTANVENAAGFRNQQLASFYWCFKFEKKTYPSKPISNSHLTDRHQLALRSFRRRPRSQQ